VLPALFYLFVYVAVCYVVINLVIGFSLKCVTDSLLKESFMSMQMHHFVWLDFIHSNCL
jgi:hypothetical protein